MEQIKDFFSDVKKRFTSPFLTSFVISWLIINWKVTVTLLFYTQYEVSKDGYKSYIDLISKVVVHPKAVTYPLVSAISYTLLYPFIKYAIQIFSVWVETYTEKAVAKISKEGYIKTEHAIISKEEYVSKRRQIEKRYNKDFKDDYDKSKAESIIKDLQNQVSNHQKHIENLKFDLLDRDRYKQLFLEKDHTLEKTQSELLALSSLVKDFEMLKSEIQLTKSDGKKNDIDIQNKIVTILNDYDKFFLPNHNAININGVLYNFSLTSLEVDQVWRFLKEYDVSKGHNLSSEEMESLAQKIISQMKFPSKQQIGKEGAVQKMVMSYFNPPRS